MLYKPWTVTTSLLLTGVLVGCNSTGRFSRDQYASLAADPFLAAPADAGGADTSAVRTANATNESFEDFPVTTTAGESSGAARSVAAPKPRPPRPSATPPESHAASTDFGSSLDAGRAGSPVVRAPETGKAAAAAYC